MGESGEVEAMGGRGRGMEESREVEATGGVRSWMERLGAMSVGERFSRTRSSGLARGVNSSTSSSSSVSTGVACFLLTGGARFKLFLAAFCRTPSLRSESEAERSEQ